MSHNMVNVPAVKTEPIPHKADVSSQSKDPSHDNGVPAVFKAGPTNMTK